MYKLLLVVDCDECSPEAVLFQQKQPVPPGIHRIFTSAKPQNSTVLLSTTDWVHHLLHVWPERYSHDVKVWRIKATTVIPPDLLLIALASPTPLSFSHFPQDPIDNALSRLGDFAYVPPDCRVGHNNEIVTRSALHHAKLYPRRSDSSILDTTGLEGRPVMEQLSFLKSGGVVIASPSTPIAHFVFLNDKPERFHDTDISFKVFCSIYTFHINNPEFRIYFHTNIRWKGLFYSKLPVVTRQVDLRIIPFKALRFQVHYADYYRYYVLNKYGGVYLDSNDTLTCESILPEYHAANRFTYGTQKIGANYNSGFFMCNRPESLISPKVMANFQTNYSPFAWSDTNEVFVTSLLPKLSLTPASKMLIMHSKVSEVQSKIRHFYQSGMAVKPETTIDNYLVNETLYARTLRRALHGSLIP